jgi:hypothetical protein
MQRDMRARLEAELNAVSGCCRCSSSAAASSFFKRRTIIIARRFRMAWPGLLDRITNGDQSVPPALIVDGPDPVKLGKAARDLRSRPKAAVIRRRLEPLLNLTKSHSSGWGLLYFETGGLRCS